MDGKQDFMAVLQDNLRDEPPIPEPCRVLASGALGMLMQEVSRINRSLERERKKAEHDANLRYNHKFCRKRCKLYKSNSCFLKSYEEQLKCVENQEYLNR